jgi:hypothetical protein
MLSHNFPPKTKVNNRFIYPFVPKKKHWFLSYLGDSCFLKWLFITTKFYAINIRYNLLRNKTQPPDHCLLMDCDHAFKYVIRLTPKKGLFVLHFDLLLNSYILVSFFLFPT